MLLFDRLLTYVQDTWFDHSVMIIGLLQMYCGLGFRVRLLLHRFALVLRCGVRTALDQLAIDFLV